MKKLTIPATIELKGTKLVKDEKKGDFVEKEEAKKFTFAEFVRFLLDGDPRASDSGTHLRAAVRLENATWKARAGASVEIENDDAKLLAEIAESPKCGYPSLIVPWGPDQQKRINTARQILPYINAIAEAAK